MKDAFSSYIVHMMPSKLRVVKTNIPYLFVIAETHWKWTPWKKLARAWRNVCGRMTKKSPAANNVRKVFQCLEERWGTRCNMVDALWGNYNLLIMRAYTSWNKGEKEMWTGNFEIKKWLLIQWDMEKSGTTYH